MLMTLEIPDPLFREVRAMRRMRPDHSNQESRQLADCKIARAKIFIPLHSSFVRSKRQEYEVRQAILRVS